MKLGLACDSIVSGLDFGVGLAKMNYSLFMVCVVQSPSFGGWQGLVEVNSAECLRGSKTLDMN